MIIRARPKYLKTEHFEDLQDDRNQRGFYFNTGRATLLFLLKNLKKYYNIKKPVIVIQSFNCFVVAEAALKAKWDIKLIDISTRGDFSITLDTLKRVENVHACLLTHYQGIPNFDYIEIAKYCKKTGIILIEDIAQTYGSSINKAPIGTLGDFSMESYAFDKPFTCWQGGKLNINRSGSKIPTLIQKEYHNLDEENPYRAQKDIEWLELLFSKTGDSSSKKLWLEHNIAKKNFDMGINPKTLELFYFKPFNLIFKLLLNLVSKNTLKDYYLPQKLHPSKIKLINLQKKDYKYDNSEVEALENLLAKNGCNYFRQNLKDVNIHWNRYSILDKDNEIKTLMKSLNVQAQNYNWPQPLHDLYKNNKNVLLESNNFKHSDMASINVINIPVWSNFFQKLNS